MELQKTLVKLGFPAQDIAGTLRVVLGKPPPVKAQGCEAAVLVLARLLAASPDYATSIGFAVPVRPEGRLDARIAQDHASKVRAYGLLTANQLVMLHRPEVDGHTPGLVWKYREALEGLGFDTEQVLDQAPPDGPEPPGEPGIEIEVQALVHETGKAWLLVVNGVSAWFPKKLCQLIGKDPKLRLLTRNGSCRQKE
jgi:hypothetical protein